MPPSLRSSDPLRHRLAVDDRTRPAMRWGRRLVGGRRRPLPDFVIIGAQKAGTTSLHAWLSDHDDVRAPMVKETRYFDLHSHRPTAFYRAHFPVRPSGARWLTGEATPEYLHLPWVPSAMRRVVPDARLVVMLRDPAARAFSHYHHSRSRGEEWLDFDQALAAEPRRVRGGETPRSRAAVRNSRHGYVTRGRYAEQLERWFGEFPRAQVLVVFHDDLVNDPASVDAEVLDHLGLEHRPAAPPPWLNATTPHDASYDHAELLARFDDADERLERLLGRPLPWRRAR